MKTVIEFITPDIAKSYLYKNTKNRPVSLPAVKNMADDMLNGEWIVSHQGIAFNTDGDMIDGQHRMLAVLEAKRLNSDFQGIDIMVSRDVLDLAKSFIDTGIKRTPGHVLSMEGFSYFNVMASLARQIIVYNKQKDQFVKGQLNWKKYPNINNFDVLEFCKKNDLFEFVKFGIQMQGKGAFMSQKLWVFLTWFLFNIDKDKATEFLTLLSRGTNLDEKSAILYLRNKLIANRTSTYRFNDFIALIFVIKTWNAWINNAEIKKMYYSTTDYFPKIEKPKMFLM